MKAVFLTSTAEIRSEGQFDVAVLTFDVENTQGIMRFFAKARRNNGQVRVQIEPIHRPDRLVLSNMSVSGPKKMTRTFEFGYAVDQVGPGNSKEGLMMATPFVPIDSSNMNGDGPTMTQDAFDATFDINSNEEGQLVLSVAVSFKKAQLNG